MVSVGPLTATHLCQNQTAPKLDMKPEVGRINRMRLLVIVFLFSNVCFAETGDKNFTVSRDEISQQLSDFDKEIKERKAIPTIRNGKIVGYTGRPKKNANKPAVFDNIRLVPSEDDSSQSIQR